MQIPVFVSCPTQLTKSQDASRQMILRELTRQGLAPRALGRSDYPTDLPLREVAVIAKHCSGAVILGFEQFCATAGSWKRGTPEERQAQNSVLFPTPWNHLEAGILFGLKLPLLVFREEGIGGGIFDAGVTDAFIHPMPTPGMSRTSKSALVEVFRKWQARVREHYYREI
ncbi:MAG TPA: hypothetical protein VF710_16770 [Longimicrobium sp.]|jgi:hypothetical protein